MVRCVICGNVTIFLIVGLTDPYRDQLMTWPLYHPESTESSRPNTENYGGKTVIWGTVYALKFKQTNKKKRAHIKLEIFVIAKLHFNKIISIWL